MISDIKSVAGSWKLSCQFSDIPSFAKALNGKKTIIMIFKNMFIPRGCYLVISKNEKIHIICRT